MTESIDNTRTHEGAQPATDDAAATGVRGGDANERMDGDNSGRGADGDTAAREELRVSLGERSEQAGQENGAPGLDA